jgi:hypothetical protein
MVNSVRRAQKVFGMIGATRNGAVARSANERSRTLASRASSLPLRRWLVKTRIAANGLWQQVPSGRVATCRRSRTLGHAFYLDSEINRTTSKCGNLLM